LGAGISAATQWSAQRNDACAGEVTSFATDRFTTGLAVAAAVDVLAFVVTWLIARRLGRYNVVDVTWSLAIAAIALVSFMWSIHAGGDMARRSLVLATTVIWAVRLAGHIGNRNRGHGEDPRYAAILSRASGSVPMYALLRVFLPQAVIAFAISMPLQVAMYQHGGHPALDVVGAVVFVTGLIFEAVGDAQLAAFVKRRTSSEEVMDSGLWRYTRHPNYFGEALLWFGLWLPAAGDCRGMVAVLSPVIVTYLVGFASGKPLLEKAMAKRKPTYAEYMARTSGFIPLPPKRHRSW
jgi:steroid 5-alpha reductase family enzyme